MLRVAFIGAGRMARHHVRAIGRLDTPVTIVGVHDRLPERAAALAALAGAPACASSEALLAETRPHVVHVCTPPDAHAEAARAALLGGAHVYVEKPFARTVDDARALLDLAADRGLQACAGHQLLRDAAFRRLLDRAPQLGAPVLVDSHFAFRPPGAAGGRALSARVARDLIDILPHPLYVLVAVLERVTAAGTPMTLAWAHATATEVHALVSAGDLMGRLSVTLRGRPVASTVSLTGTAGALTCDLMRSILVGAANPGTEALEKVVNPLVEGAQLAGGALASAAGRLRAGTSYPGLAESIGTFYRAVAAGRPSPLPPSHVLTVTELFAALASSVEAASRASAAAPRAPYSRAKLTVLTGARGFLGAAIARRLPHVRGVGRDDWTGEVPVHEWIAADLAAGIPAGALAGAAVVVHAAAETSGGFDEHQRNTIDATANLLDAMHDADVRRLVLISSLSVLRPPRFPWERQNEDTPLADNPRTLGAYAWGKTRQEALVASRAAALGIDTRIVRPGAIIDLSRPELPGLMGRRLLGRWHLVLGGPYLPIAVCDVERCADAIAWCIRHFDEAPPVVNLFDPAIATRRDLLTAFRGRGWAGRVCWMPISVVALGLAAGRVALALGRGQRPERQDAWAVLRPRRYDRRLASALLAMAGRPHARVDGRDAGRVESTV